MSGKLSRSWQLVKSSARVLSSEPDLLVLPLLSLVGAVAVMAAIYFGIAEPLGLQDIFDDQSGTDSESQLLQVEHFIVLFLLFFGTSTVVTFFGVALASAVLARYRGEPGGVGFGLGRAAAKIGPILGYAALRAGLSVFQRFLQGRAGVAGRAASGVIGIAAGIATFLVTPVIASERVGAMGAIRRSAVLLRDTWGENIVGRAGLGLVFMLMILVLVVVGGVTGSVLFFEDSTRTLGIAVIGLVGLAFLAIVVTQAALTTIYKTALYAYAVDGSVPQSFAPAEIEQAFQKKGAAATAAG